MSVEYKGKKYKSIFVLAKEHGISRNTVYTRMKRGLTLEEAFSETNYVGKGRCKKIEYNGKIYYSIMELLKSYNVSRHSYYGLLKKGVTLEEILSGKIISKNNKKTIEYNGKKYTSIREFAIKNNFNINTVYARFRKGMTPEEVLNFKRRSTLSKSVEYDGEIYPTRLDFANKFNIPYHRVSACLNAGHTPAQIIEKSNKAVIDGRRNPKQPIEFDGKLYETQKDLAEEYGVDFSTFRYKLYSGLSVEEALGIYDNNADEEYKKEIWQELVIKDEPLDAEKGYELLKELGLDKNTNSAEFEDVEDFELQKWMFVK